MQSQILAGHVLDVLQTIPRHSIHACITSPPYYKLRDYHTPNQYFPGKNIACEHHWIEDAHFVKKHNHGQQNSTLQRGNINPNAAWFESTRDISPDGSATCNRCGAWFGQLGLEPTPDMFVEHLTDIFRMVKQVLHPSGTLWINIGDSYNGSMKGYNQHGNHYAGPKQATNTGSVGIPPTQYTAIQEKNLLLIPQRLAISLQQDGWIIRGMFPWVKKNGLPESVKDRPVNSHEFWIMATPNPQYFFDAHAVKQDMSVTASQTIRYLLPEDTTNHTDIKRRLFRSSDIFTQSLYSLAQEYDKYAAYLFASCNRNCVVADPDGFPQAFFYNTNPYKGAHFATFNKSLIYPMIKMSTSEHGCCPHCYSPYIRQVKEDIVFGDTTTDDIYNIKISADDKHYVSAYAINQKAASYRKGSIKDAQTLFPDDPEKQRIYQKLVHEYRHIKSHTTTGWAQTCSCQPSEPVPCVVLDPFGGSGTTGEAAIDLHRKYVLIELNEEYIRTVMKPRLENYAHQESFF